jgi:hypothetical protein
MASIYSKGQEPLNLWEVFEILKNLYPGLKMVQAQEVFWWPFL